MAKRKSGYKRMKKIEPSVMKFTFGVPVTSGFGSNTLDLSQCASLVNRRFYRQGINWAVSGFKFAVEGSLEGELAISKLPSTWIMSNSWEKGFRSWQRMNNEALAESESVRPRFLDFKIYADSIHHAAGYGGNLLPAGFTGGEWESSKYVIPLGNQDPGDTEEFEVIAVGPSYPGNSPVGENLNAVSLIEGYASSRGLPNVLDPNAPSDAADSQGVDPENWIQALFNEGTDQSLNVLEDMISENNIAPYPFENDGVNTDTMYPNGANQNPVLELHDFTNFTATSIGNISRAEGGMFPCGLVRIDHTNWNVPQGETRNVLMQITLVPGNHRGYLCEPMTDM